MHIDENWDLFQRMKWHSYFSLFGLISSLVALGLIVTVMVLMPHYQLVGSRVLDGYIMISVCLHMPLLHHMILSQEVSGQKIVGRG